MTLSDYSIRNPVFAWMLMVGMILFGWFSFKKLGISQLPDVDSPTVSVSITLEGAAPEVMETQVTDVIEEAVMSLQGISKVQSSSRQGKSTINIEFDLGRDVDVAIQEIQTRISQVQKNLPQNIDPPVINKSNPEDQPIMWVAVSARVSQQELMSFVRDSLKDQFSVLPGVGDIILGGYVAPNLRVWVKQDQLNSYQLTVSDVVSAIKNEHVESPAGTLDNGQQEFNVRVMGEATNLDEFNKILIAQRSGQPIWKKITLGDVAYVEEGLNDVRSISRHMGVMGAGLGIKKLRGENAVQVAHYVKDKIEIIKKSLPEGYHLEVVFDGTQFIEESTGELIFTLILSAILTGFVCWCFLGSLSSTLNVLLAIPTSIMGSFILLNLFGFTLNTFTLLGLALAIGIVVDDAIMVLENIVRHHEEGKSKVRAALNGAREITSAAMAASLAILAIFVPVLFMPGIEGKFLFQFGVTMTVAVMISLLEALTLAPMRCSQYLNVNSKNPIYLKLNYILDGLKQKYTNSLRWCLNHRWKVIFISIIFFSSSLILIRIIPKEFVPSQDQSRFLVRILTPMGSSLHFTDEVTKKAEEIILKIPAVSQYYVAVGGFGGDNIAAANMFVTLKDISNRPFDEKSKQHLTQKDVMNLVRKKFSEIPGVMRIVVQDLSLNSFGSGRGFPIEFTLYGSKWDEMGTLSKALIEEMKASGMMQDIDTDYRLGVPEVQVIPNREKANAHGVSMSVISETINALMGGVRVARYSQDGKRFDVRVRIDGEQRKTVDDIHNIWLRNRFGELVKMSDVVSIETKTSLTWINRTNRERAINLTANVVDGKSQAEALAEVKRIAARILPEGYRISFAGSSQTFEESNTSIGVIILMGILVAYMILASQYNSFIHPITVLMALPFSVTGAFVGLALTGQSLNLYSMIGLVLLMGIVKKNSILLVDFTNDQRHQGVSAKDALLHACPLRLRPILMTSFATVAGALPAAMGIGPGAETRIPMAIVVIGGVFVSTFLTLFVVPCVYSLFVNLENHKHDLDLKEALNDIVITDKNH